MYKKKFDKNKSLNKKQFLEETFREKFFEKNVAKKCLNKTIFRQNF